MDTTALPLANRLLASLPAASYACLLPHLEQVFLERHKTLNDIIGPIDYVNFPTTAMISALVETANGASAEVALIGNDGASGITTLLCGIRAPFRTWICNEGHAYRVRMDVLQNALANDAAFHRVMLRYLTARMVQMAGNSLCNGRHSVVQRFSRALLMRLERAADDRLFITQEMMADILSVRRPGVTKAAASLRRAGAIAYQRGHLTVLDRKALEACACECYSAIREQIQNLQMIKNASLG